MAAGRWGDCHNALVGAQTVVLVRDSPSLVASGSAWLLLLVVLTASVTEELLFRRT
jgi:hypothetical protein